MSDGKQRARHLRGIVSIALGCALLVTGTATALGVQALAPQEAHAKATYSYYRMGKQQVKVTKKKLVTTGSIVKAKTLAGAREARGAKLSSKKRSFALTKKTKYRQYSSGYDPETGKSYPSVRKITKKQLQTWLGDWSPSWLDLTVRGGKVVKVEFCFAM